MAAPQDILTMLPDLAAPPAFDSTRLRLLIL